MPISVSAVQTAAGWTEARRLIESYVDSLDIDLSFQDYSAEMAGLETVYGKPDGVFFLAHDGTQALGCIGLRRLSPDEGEMKRLYVVPEARARGVGALLAGAVIDQAKALGYRRLLLDTLPSMVHARALYARLGFDTIAPYRTNPVEGAAFMALDLRRA